MGRFVALLYGLVSYAVFFVTFLYAVAFVGNMPVPKTIDSGTVASLPESLIVNLALLSLFAMQHSVMARPAFKEWWTRNRVSMLLPWRKSAPPNNTEPNAVSIEPLGRLN